MKYTILSSMLIGSVIADGHQAPAPSLAELLDGTDLLCHVANSQNATVFSTYVPSNATACFPAMPMLEIPEDCSGALNQVINATMSTEEGGLLGSLNLAALLTANAEVKGKLETELKAIVKSQVYGYLVEDLECIAPAGLFTLMEQLPTLADSNEGLVASLFASLAQGLPSLEEDPKNCTEVELAGSQIAMVIAQMTQNDGFPPIRSKPLQVALALLTSSQYAENVFANAVEFATWGTLLQTPGSNVTAQHAYGNLTYAGNPGECPCAAANGTALVGLDSVLMKYLSADFVPVWNSALEALQTVFGVVIGQPGSATFVGTCENGKFLAGLGTALQVCKPVADMLLEPLAKLMFYPLASSPCYENLCGEAFPMFPLFDSADYPASNMTVVKKFVADVDVNVFGGVGNALQSMSASCGATLPPTPAATTPEPSAGASATTRLSVGTVVATVAALAFLERA